MAISPNDRQRVMRTSRVEEAPNPGPWPQATPVAEVSQPDGDNYTGYDDDAGGGGGPGPAPTPALALSSNDWNPSGGPLPACTGQSSDPGTNVVVKHSVLNSLGLSLMTQAPLLNGVCV